MLANLHPYVIAAIGGILIGLASWLLWWGLGRIAGVSSITSDVLSAPANPDTWRWAFLAGLIIGGCLLGQGLGLDLRVTCGKALDLGDLLGSGEDGLAGRGGRRLGGGGLDVGHVERGRDGLWCLGVGLSAALRGGGRRGPARVAAGRAAACWPGPGWRASRAAAAAGSSPCAGS